MPILGRKLRRSCQGVFSCIRDFVRVRVCVCLPVAPYINLSLGISPATCASLLYKLRARRLENLRTSGSTK